MPSLAMMYNDQFYNRICTEKVLMEGLRISTSSHILFDPFYANGFVLHGKTEVFQCFKGVRK